MNVHFILNSEKSILTEYSNSVNIDCIIDYTDIIIKLMKSDPYKMEPTKLVVGSILLKIIRKEVSKYTDMIYVVSELSDTILLNIEKILKLYCEDVNMILVTRDTNYNLETIPVFKSIIIF